MTVRKRFSRPSDYEYIARHVDRLMDVTQTREEVTVGRSDVGVYGVYIPFQNQAK